ncbi:hypothetical protein JCM10213_000046 [Rhodosporidiobolus nylandii]
MPSVTPAWQTVAAREKASLDAKLASFPVPKVAPTTPNVQQIDLAGTLSAREIEITEVEVEGLVERLQKGEYKAEEVTRAFIARAAVAHSLTNCLTGVFFEKAIERAKFLDAEFARTGKPTGPLHGLPVSLKNQCNVEGEEMNLCYVGWVGRVAKENAVVVDCLLAQGAVIYCHTNMPQALFSGETVCNLHGRTVNPFNRELAAGGSSGGEGALIAMRGSVLGVGSDIGGSVRIPSAFNGLYGFRPSYNRIPYGGASNSQEGQETVPSVLGPMSSSLSGLKLFFKAVLDAQPWKADPLALHMPFSESAYSLAEHGGEGGQLCFGLLEDNGIVRPDAPYARAMKEMKEALEAKGHKVIDYTPPEAAKGAELLVSIFLADGGADVNHECAISGEPNLGGVLAGAQPKHLSTYEFWQLSYARRRYIAEQLKAWESTKDLTGTGRPIDAIISPPAPYVSFKHGEKQDIYYTGQCNINDWPTTVLPVTTVDAQKDVKQPLPEGETFHSEFDKLNYERYDPAVFGGMPVALQIIGRKGEDEAVLRMTEIADAALKQHKAASSSV